MHYRIAGVDILDNQEVSPAYSLILGALIGGLAGGFSLEEVVVSMTEGVKDVSSAVLRILTAGVLSGVLIKTGAAMTISNAIIRFWGEQKVYRCKSEILLY